MVDFHSHILPGIDDGSRSVEESITMLQLLAEQGVTHVVATPHFYARHDRPEVFLERRKKAAGILLNELVKYPGLPEVSIGAEVYYFRGISESDLIPQLTIDQKRCIMIESPGSPWNECFYQELEQIHRRWGITPVVAHMDRYIAPLRTHRIPQRLRELPVAVQANASFFTNRATAGMAVRLLRDGYIQLLGTDCHNTFDRAPNMGAAAAVIEKNLGIHVLENIRVFSRELLEL
ncbi:MAG: hypothetical protein IJ412_05225 [Oscillospiraceae bacterium]|nr:hypothetical protein [Oscillospiraceae bacterium]